MTASTNDSSKIPLPINSSCRIYAVILGSFAGVGGVIHGIFEILQGNTLPSDILLRIGAFTVIPNYLITGICAVFFGICVVIWTVTNIQNKWGPTFYLLLSAILTLVGGGIALILGSILAWAVATRIRKPLLWWKKILSIPSRKILSSIWLGILLIGFVLFISGFAIWSFILPPGEIREVTTIHYVCWSLLISGTIFLIFTIICGFAHDIEKTIPQNK